MEWGHLSVERGTWNR